MNSTMHPLPVALPCSYQWEGSKHCPAVAYIWFGQDAVGKTGNSARVDQEISANCDDTRRFSNRPPLGDEWDMPFTMIYAERMIDSLITATLTS